MVFYTSRSESQECNHRRGFPPVCSRITPTHERMFPRSVLVIDNASIHKVAGIRKMVEGRGASSCLYLPAYSPDLNPIELAFSAIKTWLRTNRDCVNQELDAENGVVYNVFWEAVISARWFDSTQGKVWTDISDKMLRGESWGRGSGRDAGTERGVHGGAARKEKGADLCTVAQRTRANEGNGSARRRGTRIGNADERRGFYSVGTR